MPEVEGNTRRRSWLVAAAALVVVAGVGAGIGAAVAVLDNPSSAQPAATQSFSMGASVDPGTSLSRPAPTFTLTDQFGHPVSLRSFRGKVVVLAFNDPVCTTICPLTTTAMVEAKQLLGAAGSRVQLLGVGANPQATAVKWVRAYSQAHGMLHQWDFLTAPLPRLKRVWADYGIAAQLVNGEIDHTPALYVIDTKGRERRLYETQMGYAGVGEQATVLAREISRLLPGHPAVHSRLASGEAVPLPPTARVELPRPEGGTVQLGPGAPRLYVFFASWLAETSDLRADLAGLNGYEKLALKRGLPPLTAVDEGSVEPSPAALKKLLASLPEPLRYPVGIDPTGRVADGYRVEDQPWFVLVSGSGRFLWYYDASVLGWPSTQTLASKVRAALAHAAKRSAQ